MKIGILTFHRAINYGAVLQCYALFKTLSLMGNEVEVIDYRPWYIEKSRQMFEMEDMKRAKGLLGKIRYLLSCLCLISSKIKTSQKFDSFLSHNIRFSDIINNNDVQLNYDCVVFGSDQIWSPEICTGLDNMYMGQFPKNNMKFISYAASVGKSEIIQGNTASEFHHNLYSFDAISVREKDLQVFLKRYFNIDSKIVCDPSLLLYKKDYLSIAYLCNENNYVLLYDMIDDKEAFIFAKRIAYQLNAKIIELKAELNPFRKRKHIRSEVSPEQFIGYINKALCVVTNSFHVTSFSIIFQKDFYTLIRNNNNERSRTILSKVGLLERMVKADEIIQFSSIDYKTVVPKLERYREDSLKFISDIIK